MLLSLPEDLLQAVLDRCGPKTLARASCVCTTLRSATRAPNRRLAVRINREAGHGAVLAWLRAWAPHVRALKVYGLALHGRCGSVTHLRNLQHLHISCSAVDDRILEILPGCLVSLHLRKLRPRIFFDVLSLARFDRLASTLRHLSLVLHPDWTSAHLDFRCLHLESLLLEAPAIYAPRSVAPASARLHLCAMDTLEAAPGATVSLAPWSRIRVAETDVQDDLFCALDSVKYFSLSCPWRAMASFVAGMPRLQELHLRLDIAVVDFAVLLPLRSLQKVRIRTRFGFTVTPTDRKFPRDFDAELYVNLRRMPASELCETN